MITPALHTDLSVLVIVSIPGRLKGSLVIALDLAGLSVERDTSGGHGDLKAPLAAAGVGQLVSSAHSVQVLFKQNGDEKFQRTSAITGKYIGTNLHLLYTSFQREECDYHQSKVYFPCSWT